jgi:hypothetical protein
VRGIVSSIEVVYAPEIVSLMEEGSGRTATSLKEIRIKILGFLLTEV